MYLLVMVDGLWVSNIKVLLVLIANVQAPSEVALTTRFKIVIIMCVKT